MDDRHGKRELKRRVDTLERWSPRSLVGPGRSVVADPDVAALVELLAPVHISYGEQEYGGPLACNPEDADAAMGRSSTLAHIRAKHPEMHAPLRRRQTWIGSPRHEPLAQHRFAEGGLFTSTPDSCHRGMWRTYLDLGDEGLIDPPWKVWTVYTRAGVRVLEIDSAVEWAETVTQASRPSEWGLRPDWTALATDYDAVHFSVSAVAALHGFTLLSVAGRIAPRLPTVESTYWLRWCFEETELVEVVRTRPEVQQRGLLPGEWEAMHAREEEKDERHKLALEVNLERLRSRADPDRLAHHRDRPSRP